MSSYVLKCLHLSSHIQHEESFSSLTLGMEDVYTCIFVYAHLHVHCKRYMYVQCLLLQRLSQNEGVNCVYTSPHRVADLLKLGWHTAMKVLLDKTYNFVDELQEASMEHNKTDFR